MEFNIQPIIVTEEVILYPLQEKDIEFLYTTASDPKIWEQHPNKDRWKKDIFNASIFQIFFFNDLHSTKAKGKILLSQRPQSPLNL